MLSDLSRLTLHKKPSPNDRSVTVSGERQPTGVHAFVLLESPQPTAGVLPHDQFVFVVVRHPEHHQSLAERQQLQFVHVGVCVIHTRVLGFKP